MATGFNDLIYTAYSSRYRNAPNTVTFTVSGWGNSISLEDSKAFTKYVKMDLEKELLEIPCIYKYPISKALSNNNLYRNSNPEKVLDTLYIPMVCLESLSTEARSSNTLLKSLFYETPPVTGLRRRNTANTKYIGGEGILLYEDFTPLLMFTMTVKRVPTRVEQVYKYEPLKQILHINPIVYQNNDMLAKYIRTKFLTGCLNMVPPPLYYSNSKIKNIDGIYTSRELPWKFTIVIDDFSEFFVVPTIPDATYSNREMNNILKDNLETILNF